MGKFKEKHGKTRLGLFLKDVAPDVLDIVGDLTGVGALSKVADVIEGKPDSEIPPEVKQKILQLALQDVQNARKTNVEILTSKFAPPISKITPYIIDLLIVGTWVTFTFYIAGKLIGLVKGGGSTESLMALYLSVSGMSGIVLNYHRGNSSKNSGEENK